MDGVRAKAEALSSLSAEAVPKPRLLFQTLKTSMLKRTLWFILAKVEAFPSPPERK